MDETDSHNSSSVIKAPNHRIIPLGVAVILLMIISGVVGYFIGINQRTHANVRQQNNSYSKPSINSQNMSGQQASTCAKQGIQSRDDYLPVYIVQSGDSLLSIAKFQLKDGSRVSELITLNSDRYPELSLKNPFLEKGWKLYLPPQSVGVTNGYISMISGNVAVFPENKNLWGVTYIGGQGGTFPSEALTKDNLKQGDCVTVLYQGGKDLKLFSVARQ